MKSELRGRVLRFGDDVDTDGIIPARYCTAYTPEELGPHCMEGLDKDFAKKVKPGDFIVSGRNFGCGSSRENAPIAIKGAGIAGVIAASFARIFFRNAINVGLPIFESKEAAEGIKDGDEITVSPGRGIIKNHTSGKSYRAQKYPQHIKEIIESGGMVHYVRKKLGK